MSQTPEGQQDTAKKTRLRGSCDECRRRKAKCNSAKMPRKVCSGCIALKIECRHDFSNRVKPTVEYAQHLEERIAKFEAYFRRTRPGEDIDQIINDALPKPQPQNTSSSATTDIAFLGSTRHDDSESSDNDDNVPDDVEVANLLSGLSINYDRKFFGQSSAFSFAKTAAFSGRNVNKEEGVTPDEQNYRRPFFWEVTPWELAYATSPETPYVYPEQDLLLSLVSLYFDKMNSLIPVLHQPTFMRLLLSGEHLSDPSFGMTVLLVCALGSRYSDDPRVHMHNDLLGMSAGWRYFSQISTHRRRMLYKPLTIYDLQYYALAALYLNGCSNPNATWHVLGIGLRYAIERGAHRRKNWQGQQANSDDELQKRAFWTIVCLDRLISSFVGRPYGYPHELIDVEYPIECDDEYWDTDDPSQAFKQPQGKPCTITAFVLFIKLCDILCFATRILYSNKECKEAAGSLGREGEARMVPELDSLLNKWRDSLPEHLIWDPHRQDPVFFHQSANIYALYHYIQIQIHRPFLTKKSSLTYASLAMCTTAARSCSRILEAAVTRGIRVSPSTKSAIFTAGLFIVFALRHSSSRSREEDAQNLQRCINVLKECEKKKWHAAGRLSDMLMEAGSVTKYEPSGTRKRRRQSFDVPETGSQPEPIALMQPEGTAHGYAGSENGSASSIMDAYALTAPMTNWDLHRLLLMDTPHLQMDSAEDNANVLHHGFGDIPFDSQIPDTTITSSNHGQLTDTPDLFSWWSDIPTAFRSLEEWETHIATGGQMM